MSLAKVSLFSTGTYNYISLFRAESLICSIELRSVLSTIWDTVSLFASHPPLRDKVSLLDICISRSESLLTIADICCQFPNLRTVRIAGSQSDEVSYSNVFRAILSTKVSSLQLDKATMGGDDLIMIAENWRELTKLSVYVIHFSFWTTLSELLPRFKKLQSVEFGALFRADEHLLTVLENCPDIQELNVLGGALNNQALRVAMTRNRNSLRKLHCTWAVTNAADVDGAHALWKGLESLEVQSSSQEYNNDAENAALAVALAHMPQLRALRLIDLQHNCRPVFAAFATHCRNLHTLVVDNWEVQEPADQAYAVNLTKALRENHRTLTQFNICCWEFCISLSQLLVMLSPLQRLRELYVCLPDIVLNDAILTAVAPNFPLLEVITIDARHGNKNTATDHGVLALAEYCPRLREISFEGCTSITAAALITLVQRCRQLQYLVTDGLSISGPKWPSAQEKAQIEAAANAVQWRKGWKLNIRNDRLFL